MSARATQARSRVTAAARPRRPAARRKKVMRRRVSALLFVAALGLLAAAVAYPLLERRVREVTLPLKHEDIIRQQAKDKDLDPALIAGVIYAESKFRDETSSAGARGLMQITPDTADYIAQKSGGFAFEQGDLAKPQINISYGSFYLRYLSDRYDGHEPSILAAYNAGEGNVDKWIAKGGENLEVSQIPFAETRHYVERVLSAKRDYRRHYRRELGL